MSGIETWGFSTILIVSFDSEGSFGRAEGAMGSSTLPEFEYANPAISRSPTLFTQSFQSGCFWGLLKRQVWVLSRAMFARRKRSRRLRPPTKVDKETSLGILAGCTPAIYMSVYL